MKPYLIAYAASFAAFLMLDAIWLGLVARSFYVQQMGNLLKDNPNFAIAFLFYLVYALAITHLAIAPHLAGGNWLQVLIAGAMLGLAAYGAYNLTNLAVLENWPVKASFVDWAWGTIVTSLTALAGFTAVRYFS